MLFTLTTVISFLTYPVTSSVTSLTYYNSFNECEKSLNFLNENTKIQINNLDIDADIKLIVDKETDKSLLFIEYLNLPIMTFSRCIKTSSSYLNKHLRH